MVWSGRVISWVLMRGLTRESGHWGDFIQRLGSRVPAGDRVVTLDLPGNGRRYRERSPWTVPAMANACRAEAIRLGVEPPFVLVAMSLGALVALEWSHQAHEQVAGVVMINMSARGTSAPWRRLRPRSYPNLLRLLRPGLPPLAWESLVLAMTSSDPGRHSDALAHWVSISAQRPVSRANAFRQLAAAGLYLPASPPASIPFLLLNSGRDRLVSPECSRLFAARWKLDLRTHPGAGHDLPLDEPGWVLDQIAHWWKPT